MEERRVRTRQSRASSTGVQKANVSQEVTGLLLAAAGVWFFLSLAGRGGGSLGEVLGQGMKSLAGESGAWILAGVIVWFGLHLVYLRFHGRSFFWGQRAWGFVILLVVIQLLLQFWQYGVHPDGGDWENARNGFGGGIIGYLFAVPLTRVFGHAGRYVVVAATLLVGLVWNTNITLGGVINWFKERLFAGAKGAGSAASDFYRLVKAQPEEADIDGSSTERSAPMRRKAASEELNTLDARAAAAAPLVIRMPELPHRSSGDIETAGARPSAAVGGEKGAMELQGRAARSVQATADKAESAADSPILRLVSDKKGQLGLDPESLGKAYQLPAITMLPKPAAKIGASRQDHLERAELLERTLRSFGVEARVVEVSPGPAVTRYELQPGEGVRVNKFTALADDLALALAAEDIRIEAPIPGKSAVGIEVPNKERAAVPLRAVMETPAFLNSASKLTVAFGKDNAGNPVVGDLAKMPHLLVAGSTGSGKSVCMNTIICSVLFKARPDEVKMLMIDPKMVELSSYNGIPHLMAPVITDVKKAAGYLKGAVKEMENRYELFAAAGARNIQQYNQMCVENPGADPDHPRKPLPYIVIFIDELADLMMAAPLDVEDSICRLAQMARACGMHLVIATQSPRVDVITGLIKANIPSRIAFAVSSQIDSRVIMDSTGAERLLGRGDMLFHPTGLSKAVRAQGAFIGEREVEELIRFVKNQGKPVFTAEEVAVELSASKRGANGAGGENEASSAADTVFPQAVRVVVEHGQASVSILQRRLRCNYNKAARLIDMMEERGYVGSHQGSKPRDVLITIAQWQELFAESAPDDEDRDEI